MPNTHVISVLNQINNAVLDLQASHFQSFSTPLKRLARLLNDPELYDINQQLTSACTLDSLLGSQTERKGFIGSARFEWPGNMKDTLGLKIQLIQKFADDPDSMFSFGHTYYYSGSSIAQNIHAVTRQMIVPFVRDYKDYVMSEISSADAPHQEHKDIFVVYGHDEGARYSVARFIEKMGFRAILLDEQPNLGRTVIEKVEQHGNVTFAVVLLTPDDEGYAIGESPKPRVRQNILLELGFFLGRLGRNKVFTLKKGDIDIPSDFAGVIWTPMDEGKGWQLALAKELNATGHSIDFNKVFN